MEDNPILKTNPATLLKSLVADMRQEDIIKDFCTLEFSATQKKSISSLSALVSYLKVIDFTDPKVIGSTGYKNLFKEDSKILHLINKSLLEGSLEFFELKDILKDSPKWKTLRATTFMASLTDLMPYPIKHDIGEINKLLDTNKFKVEESLMPNGMTVDFAHIGTNKFIELQEWSTVKKLIDNDFLVGINEPQNYEKRETLFDSMMMNTQYNLARQMEKNNETDYIAELKNEINIMQKAIDAGISPLLTIERNQLEKSFSKRTDFLLKNKSPYESSDTEINQLIKQLELPPEKLNTIIKYLDKKYNVEPLNKNLNAENFIGVQAKQIFSNFLNQFYFINSQDFTLKNKKAKI